jgi:hypothetical protein
MAFHDLRFPTAIAFHSTGGPERKTEIVTLGSGFEERNAVWANSRRRYDAGYGVKTLADIHAVIAFFEARNGRPMRSATATRSISNPRRRARRSRPWINRWAPATALRESFNSTRPTPPAHRAGPAASTSPSPPASP